LRALLEALHDKQNESISLKSQIVVGIIDDGVVNYQPVEEVLGRIYRQGTGINEDSIHKALSQLDLDEDEVQKNDPENKSRFSRRSKDTQPR
jgi:hypothetical protein